MGFSVDGDVQDRLADRLDAIRQRIRSATALSGRPDGSVKLVAVSKGRPADEIAAAMRLGQIDFGENRVQDARAKFGDWSADRACRLHVIGRLQTNKVRDAVRIADVIESVDRPELLDELEKARDHWGRMPDVLVQVNVGNEPQKSGIPSSEADRFIEQVAERFGAALKGLMCIPPQAVPPEIFFDWLAACAARHGLPEISMGMSDDFELAIARGATEVRIGSAIFGARPAHD